VHELIAPGLLDLWAVGRPQGLSQELQAFEHGQCLFWRPMSGQRQSGRLHRLVWPVPGGAHWAALRGRAAAALAARSALRCASRSSASLARYESPSMGTTSARCIRRSISETTQAALGKTSPQSANAFVGGHHRALGLIAPADDLEQQVGRPVGERQVLRGGGSGAASWSSSSQPA
jgi:hypothetical protein